MLRWVGLGGYGWFADEKAQPKIEFKTAKVGQVDFAFQW